MANYNNNELNKIVRDFAYGQGQSKKIQWLLVRLKREKQKLEDRLAQLPLEISEAKSALDIAKRELAKIRAEAELKYPKLPLKRVRAIIATPKIHGLQWGDFTRELVDVIKLKRGQPISTVEIMEHCSAKFNIPFDTPELRESLRERVGKRLREWAKRGVIRRLPTAKPKDMSYWVWVGLE